MLRIVPVLLLSLAAASCGEKERTERDRPRDPAVLQALNDPLMTDPDLSTRNEAAAALTVRTDGQLPIVPASDKEIAAARAEAAAMLTQESGVAPLPEARGRVAALAEPHLPSDHLAVLASKTACRAALSNSAIWAARLPPALPVYPRGHTQAATGGTGTGCRVAAIAFTTPIPAREVLAFYWNRAQAARLSPVRRSAGGTDVLQGQGGGTAFDLRIHAAGGETLVELATVAG